MLQQPHCLGRQSQLVRCASWLCLWSFRRNRTSVTRWSPDDLVRAVTDPIAVFALQWAHGVSDARNGHMLGLCTLIPETDVHFRLTKPLRAGVADGLQLSRS
jgi:hypothetical protein